MEEKKIYVRYAVEGDIPQMLELLSQVNRIHHVGRPDLFKLATKYDTAALLAMIDDGERPVLVAADDADVCVGYVMCQQRTTQETHLLHEVRTLYIDDLCVSESVRGQGIGTMLYEAALRLARECGCHNVTLNVWACNAEAMRFYERLGMHVQKSTMEVIL